MLSCGIGRTDEPNSGKLSVYVVTTLGLRIPGTVRVRSSSGAVVYSAGTSSRIVATLPYGRYDVEFSGEFIKPVRRQITVDSNEQFIVMGTDLASTVLDFKNSNVAMSIHLNSAVPCKSGDFLWAKLIPVFEDRAVEQLVSPNGTAAFSELNVGKYIVVIIDGTTVPGDKDRYNSWSNFV